MPYSAGYAIADIASLKAIPIADLISGYARWVISRNTWYGWDASSNLIDDNDTVIIINDTPSIGRFIKILAREILTAPRIYYVRTDGNDFNNGLSNTSAGAFLTIQKAVNVVSSLDLGVYNVTVQLADGTYTAGASLKSFVGSGRIIIQGNTSNRSAVVVSTTNEDCFWMLGQVVGTYDLRSIKLSTVTSGHGISQELGFGAIRLQEVDFGAVAGSHIFSGANGNIQSEGNYIISGGASAHISSYDGGFIRLGGVNNYTISVLNSPNFGFFAVAARNGQILAVNQNYVGTATGSRYISVTGGSIFVVGGAGNGNQSYFPGNSNGTVDSATFALYQ